ncbi:MAG: MaoC/PaaZ C-terminal domain-containing protein [Dehalococcoidia bacterium]|jgi:acyl dehydratase|nr:MaoC/PaaZ C-terminal domain-containing protein [Dehalococcoidia bacterium]
MEQKVYFEDVQEGQEVPTLTMHCDSQRLVMWAAASGDFYQIHYDKDFAQATGLPERIVHGALKHALLGRMLHEWVAPRGRVKRLAVQYRGMDMVNEDVICKGVVTKKYRQDGENIVELEVWTENPQGQKTTPGTAIVTLPSREG